MRQLIFSFIPLYIYSGAVIEKITKTKLVLIFVILLMCFSVVQAIPNFPQGLSDYSNFGISKYKTFDYDSSLDKEVIAYLDGLGKPVMTNHINTLVFYKGIKTSLVPEGEYCNLNTFEELKREGYLILYSSQFDWFRNDDTGENFKFELLDNQIRVVVDPKTDKPFFCKVLGRIKLEKIKEFNKDLILYGFAKV